jgi:hypothetical protein
MGWSVPVPAIHAELALLSQRCTKGVILVFLLLSNLEKNFVPWENEGAIETVQ